MNVEAVTKFLVSEGGYRLVSDSLSIADLEFEFEGVLLGPGEEGGLVLTVDGTTVPAPLLLKRTSSFSRVLARTNSRRPLALVLVNADVVDAGTRAELRSIARLIELSDAERLNSTLRPLLPLQLPDTAIAPAEAADAALNARLGDMPDPGLANQVIEAASLGEDAVREVIRARVSDIVSGAETEGGSS